MFSFAFASAGHTSADINQSISLSIKEVQWHGSGHHGMHLIDLLQMFDVALRDLVFSGTAQLAIKYVTSRNKGFKDVLMVGSVFNLKLAFLEIVPCMGC